MSAVSPGQWDACHGGECTCGLIWSLGADAPIARVLCRNDEEGVEYDLVTVRANARLMAQSKEMYLLLSAVFEPGDYDPDQTEAMLERWRGVRNRVDAEVSP